LNQFIILRNGKKCKDFFRFYPRIFRNIFIANRREFCYNICVMEKRTHFYVSLKNVLTWLVALCMISSAVARVFVGVKGTDVWSQILLPMVAALLYAVICLLIGKEQFYKTAIAVWMMCIYYVFLFFSYDFDKFDLLIGGLFAVAMLFVAVLYTQITSGKVAATILILPLAAFPIAARLYLHRDLVRAGDWTALEFLLPDALMALGLLLVVFAIGIHPADEYHPTWGDRTDGRRIRTEPPMNQVAPYIMVNRSGATNLFEESFEITNMERYIRQKRKEGMASFGVMHVMLACYCRALCRYPALNRFISGQKIYTHGDDIQFCMTIKKEMTSTAPESVIKIHLSPTDTAEDVYNKVNKEIENIKNSPLDSSFDNLAHLFMLIPGVFLKFVVWLLRTLDYFGLVPKFLLELSPFHGSVYFTSMGSLGIPPVFHHLYNFGNLPVFCSFGCKRRKLEVQEDGSVVQRKYIDFKISTDERIVDGFYYAAFFKHYKRLLQHPEILDNPPDEVLRDID